MAEEKIEKLLNELGEVTTEAVRPELAETIKQQIPPRLVHHKGGMDTVSIVIDLRISKLAAAAVIIITTILWASFFGSRDSEGDSIYQDSKLFIKYCLGGTSKADISASRLKYDYLVSKGKEVVYYGDSSISKDGNALLIHWKLPDGNYRVIFGNLRENTVSAEELIKLQAAMLQKK